MKKLAKEVSQKFLGKAGEAPNKKNHLSEDAKRHQVDLTNYNINSPIHKDSEINIHKGVVSNSDDHKTMKTEVNEDNELLGKNSKKLGIIKSAITKMRNKSSYSKIQNIASDADTDTEAKKTKQEYEFEMKLANDKLHETQQAMTSNINLALKHVIKLDNITSDVDLLAEKGQVFRKQTK